MLLSPSNITMNTTAQVITVYSIRKDARNQWSGKIPAIQVILVTALHPKL